MNITHGLKAKRFFAAQAVTAASAATPALLLAGTGTAHADDCYGGDLSSSYYCSPASGSSAYAPGPSISYTPSTFPNWLPGCTGGALAALDGEC
jgi:hypothetical protein